MGMSNIFRFGKTSPFYQPNYYSEEEGGYKPNLYTSEEEYYQEGTTSYYGEFGGIYASGNAVKSLQMWLNNVVRKFGNKLKIDGLYGEHTRAAVRELQEFLNRTLRIPIKIDGFYGCKTYEAVKRVAARLGWPPPPPPIWGKCSTTTSRTSTTTTSQTPTTGTPTVGRRYVTGVIASGNRVVALQKWLNSLPLGGRIAVDGLYGNQTASKVAQVQAYINKVFGEHLKVDGLYGCNTYNAIMRHLRQLGWPTPPPPIFGNCTTVKRPVPTPTKRPTNNQDEIFGIDKKYVYIGAAVGIGLLALMLATSNNGD